MEGRVALPGDEQAVEDWPVLAQRHDAPEPPPQDQPTPGA
jgi:hypothetical protein